MRVRINIPAWRGREVAAGLGALARGSRRHSALDELARIIELAVPGWTPVPVSSARYGIALAIRELGLAGKRIGVPAYLCPAVLTGLRAAPAEAVPLECAPASLRFDDAAVASAVTSNTIDAILAPNTYGVDQDFPVLGRLGIPVIEDAAYQGGLIDRTGTPCGTRGNAGVWSFNFKALTAVGGGVLLLRTQPSVAIPPASRDAAEVARFGNYALRAALTHHIPSFLPGASVPEHEQSTEMRSALGELREAGMSGLQSAVAIQQWQARETLYAAQRRNVEVLGRAIDGSKTMKPLCDPADQTPHLFPILADTRDTAFNARRSLYERGIQTEDPYPMLWEQPSLFPEVRRTASRLVLVPCNASIGAGQINRIAAALKALR